MENKRHTAFSLVEIITVLLIIAAFTGMLLPVSEKIETKANLAHDIRMVAAAKNAAYVEYYSDGREGQNVLYVFDGEKATEISTASVAGIKGYGKSKYGVWEEKYGATGAPVTAEGSSNFLFAYIEDGSIRILWSENGTAPGITITL